MKKHPIETLNLFDNGMTEAVMEESKNVFTDGKISKKNKLLIAMALDAARGTEDGVRALATMAMENGATKEEIGEVLPIIKYIYGVAGLFTAACGLDGIIE